MLFTLHLGLLLVTRLPNWQFMAMIASGLWIPTRVWNMNNSWAAVDRSSNHTNTTNYKKTDDEMTRSNEDEDKETTATMTTTTTPSKFRRIWTYFFLGYMVYISWANQVGLPSTTTTMDPQSYKLEKNHSCFLSTSTSTIKISMLGYSMLDTAALARSGRLGSARSKRVASGNYLLPKHSNQWRDFSFSLYYSDDVNPLEAYLARARVVCKL
jgi:hypothetical protein